MNNGAFDAGYDAGFKAGVQGDLIIPSVNILAAQAASDFSEHFAVGAALGFERGTVRREGLERRAEDQTHTHGLE